MNTFWGCGNTVNRPTSDSNADLTAKYIFCVGAVGMLFTGRSAQPLHMFLHVQSVIKSPAKQMKGEGVRVEAFYMGYVYFSKLTLRS